MRTLSGLILVFCAACSVEPEVTGYRELLSAIGVEGVEMGTTVDSLHAIFPDIEVRGYGEYRLQTASGSAHFNVAPVRSGNEGDPSPGWARVRSFQYLARSGDRENWERVIGRVESVLGPPECLVDTPGSTSFFASWDQVRVRASLQSSTPLGTTVERDGVLIQLTITPTEGRTGTPVDCSETVDRFPWSSNGVAAGS